VLIFLFAAETNYVRPVDTGEGADIKDAIIERERELDLKDTTDGSEKDSNVSKDAELADSHQRHYLPPKTFMQELAPWSGFNAPVSFVRVFLRPFPFALSPAVWFTFFAIGLTYVWVVTVSLVSSVVFALPPYHFTSSQTGLVSIGPLIGSIIAMILSGPLCDYSATWFAKRNNGIYEPESRLYLMLPMLILQVSGFGFWALMQTRGVHWIGLVFMYSLIFAGQGIGLTAVTTYLIDVHKKHAPECFAIVNFAKNLVLYGLTQFAVKWIESMGVLHTFGILASLSAICILTTIPMYIWGKRARSWVHRHPHLFMTEK